MGLLILAALVWLSLRTLMLISQVARHTPEAQLGRAFQREMEHRGLLGSRQGLEIDS